MKKILLLAFFSLLASCGPANADWVICDHPSVMVAGMDIDVHLGACSAGDGVILLPPDVNNGWQHLRPGNEDRQLAVFLVALSMQKPVAVELNGNTVISVILAKN